MKKETFVAFGLGIALVLAVLAPFLASQNPDGLESAAGRFESAEGKGASAFGSPLPDYTVPALGGGRPSGAAAMVFGTAVVFALSYVLAKAVRKA